MGRFRDGAADVAPVTSAAPHGRHVNEFVRAAEIREIDEVRTQNLLMTAQRRESLQRRWWRAFEGRGPAGRSPSTRCGGRGGWTGAWLLERTSGGETRWPACGS